MKAARPESGVPVDALEVSTFTPPRPETRFRHPDDQGDFARAALRCVGVGGRIRR